ncbi:substrate-binding periplasmic protein [Marinobacter caseinilyticus]|uniref:substrate-binding periplasmic protein n=1 Tax=Marinobacter caseinilyticus TaxID=2692195 RepID=UPI00140D5458|nr:transporter substrate-binding domain-containing protein [Marinobacter caseinilyticus]
MIRGIVLCLMSMVTTTQTWASEPSVLRIVTSEYPPFEYSEKGRITGKDTDTVRDVVIAMGFEPDIQLLPWIRAENQAQRGEADLIYSLTYSDQRNLHYYFTDPISEVRDVFFVHKDAGIQWQHLDDLVDLKIGVSASYSYAPVFMEWLELSGVRVTRVSHEQPELTSLKMLAYRRIDAFICERSVCDHLISQHSGLLPELTNLQALPKSVGEARPFRAAFSRLAPNAEALRDAFNQTLMELRSGS